MLSQIELTNTFSMPEMKQTLSLADFVDRQTDINRWMWYSAVDHLPELRKTYSLAEKKANEQKLSQQLDWLASGINRQFLDEEKRKHFADAAAHRLKVLGMSVLGLSYEQMAVLENEALIQSSQEFFQQARAFDPQISEADIFQASRNVWTSNYLQVLLGLEIHLTPAIFAYSMLYPVSDNYLDDPKRSKAEKIAFNRKFCAWLKGEFVPAAGKHEEQVRQLVAMIEGQYDRALYPQVYESLLAIHCAQDQSMRMPLAPVPPHTVDVVGITFKKGGTSVLADGVLAAGELSARQMEIIFNYGAFAQMMDDQEDVAGDLKEHSLTIFSEAARAGKLDLTMSRLFSYSAALLKDLDEFATARSLPLIQLSMKGIDLLLIDACLRTKQFYSLRYLRQLERFFPVRFGYMQQLRKKIKEKNLSLVRIIPAFFPAIQLA